MIGSSGVPVMIRSIGGDGAISISDGTGDDTVDAGAGNDTIESGGGDDTYNGGAGTDTVNFTKEFTSIVERGATTTITFTDGSTAVVTNIEIINIP